MHDARTVTGDPSKRMHVALIDPDELLESLRSWKRAMESSREGYYDLHNIFQAAKEFLKDDKQTLRRYYKETDRVPKILCDIIIAYAHSESETAKAEAEEALDVCAAIIKSWTIPVSTLIH